MRQVVSHLSSAVSQTHFLSTPSSVLQTQGDRRRRSRWRHYAGVPDVLCMFEGRADEDAVVGSKAISRATRTVAEKDSRRSGRRGSRGRPDREGAVEVPDLAPSACATETATQTHEAYKQDKTHTRLTNLEQVGRFFVTLL